MYIIVLFVFLAVLGYFGLKAARYGALGVTETAVFAVLSAAFTGYLIFIMYRLF
jgi:hypothetical protein